MIHKNLRTIAIAAVALLVIGTGSAMASGCDPKLLKRAHSGDVNAQSYVAHLYTSGEGVDQNFNIAKYWYQRVADHETADAKIVAHANLFLGLFYSSGKGGKQNYPKALKCFHTAANQGYYDAHVSIGNMYAQGLGVKKDYTKALHWWQIAAEKGHPKAPALVVLLKKEMAKGRKLSG